MSLTTKLAYSQLKTNKRRTIWTLLGIIFSIAMITAVYGFVASSYDAFRITFGDGFIRDVYYTAMGIIGVILSAIIVITSVIVVSNAFRISAGERLVQFGILKSAGATKKQIAKIVINEGMLLSIIGIPLGLAVGLFLNFIGVNIANYMLSDLNAFQTTDEARITFNFVLAWQAILAAIIVALLTVLLSAWLPARKAARVPAIDAIRGAGEVKIKARRIRINPIIRKLFGFEGELAAKSLKRSRRNLRATVVSLTISMVLFIGASSFGTLLFRMTNLVLSSIEMDVMVGFHSSTYHVRNEDGETIEWIRIPIDNETAADIENALHEFSDINIFGVGGDRSRYETPITQLQFTREFTAHMERHDWLLYTEHLMVTLLTVDAANYAELARRAGVPPGSNILVNHARTRIGDNWAEIAPLNFTGQGITLRNVHSRDEGTYLPIHGELRGADVPNEIVHASASYIVVIVPETDINFYFWMVQTDEPTGFVEYAREFFWEMLPYGDNIVTMGTVQNVTDEYNMMRALFNTIMVAIYGFIGLLTLIALTNVISTISTNVRSRAREFAILQSVGMTHGGMKNMLNLESILCSLKSLAFGIPLGLGASYLIYLGMMEAVWFPFPFPWMAVLQCIVAVFAITWVTMRFAVSRLKDKNIVDSIRAEAGM